MPKEARYFAVCVAVALVLTPLVLWRPAILAIVGGALFMPVILARPKVLCAITLLASMTTLTMQQLSGVAVLGSLDEMLIILCVFVVLTPNLIRRKKFRRLPGNLPLLIFIALGVAGGVFNGASASLILQDGFLLTKGFLFAFLVAQLDWAADDLRRVVKGGGAVIAVVLAAGVINLGMPGAWAQLFGDKESVRAGVASLIGPFTHPSFFGQVTALAAIAVGSYRAVVRKSGMSLALLIGSILGVVLSVRRKAIIGLLGVALWFGLARRPAATLALLAAVLPFAIYLSWDQLIAARDAVNLEYFVNPEGSARTVLYKTGLELSVSNFPGGVGFSRYGTFVAGSSYSPLYYDLGFPSVWGLQPDGRFLTDTYWPGIFAETGILGAAALIAALGTLATHSWKLFKRATDPLVKWIAVVGTGWSLEYLFESAASPVYSSPPTYLILFAALGIVISLSDSNPALSPAKHERRALR